MEMIQNYQEAIERALGNQVSYWVGLNEAVTKYYRCVFNKERMTITCYPLNTTKCPVFIEIGEEKKAHE